MISDLPHIDKKVYKAFTENNYNRIFHACTNSVYQASPWEGGMGGGGGGKGGRGEGPGNEADTMEDCIDSALCEYGFMLKSSDFHNGDLLSKNSALSANIEFELEAILFVQVDFQLNSDYCTKVLQGACTVLY